MTCISCLRNFHEECNIGCDSCHTDIPIVELEHKQNEGLAWSKDDDNVRDRESTGRKRAAKLFPLDPLIACEWQDARSDNPKGGGQKPITGGCANNQQARHHGPDKSTLNNSEGNVHRICHSHHVTWHHHNDDSRQPKKTPLQLLIEEGDEEENG